MPAAKASTVQDMSVSNDPEGSKINSLQVRYGTECVWLDVLPLYIGLVNRT